MVTDLIDDPISIFAMKKNSHYSPEGYKIISKGFDIDVELSTVLTILNKREIVPQIIINYKRRNIEEGKKLKVSDGWTILERIIKMIKYL